MDILVELLPKKSGTPKFTLFDMARMEFKLEETTGVDVDVRFENGLSERNGDRLNSYAI